MMIVQENAVLCLQPEGELTIYQVEDLARQLREGLSGASTVVVNLADTDKIDTAGFELIVALEKSCKAAGKRFELTGIGGAVEEFFSLYGYGSRSMRRRSDGD